MPAASSTFSPIAGGSLHARLARFSSADGPACAIRSCAEVLVGGRGRDARATGLRLADGATGPAECVVVNADPLYARRALFAPARRRAALGRPPAQAELSCSGFVLLLGTDGRWAQLAHH